VHAQSVQDTSPATALPPKEEIKVADAKQEPPAVVSPPSATAPVTTNAKSRILTLEPVERDPSITIAAVDATSAYPPTIGVAEVRASEAQPPAARRPARVTNVADQLAVPIESIDLPAMPVGKFVNLVSGMASVPIRLDAKVLGEVGLSMRSTVTVHGENTTIGKLLAGVLMQHQLTCVERDGVLVVVPAKR